MPHKTVLKIICQPPLESARLSTARNGTGFKKWRVLSCRLERLDYFCSKFPDINVLSGGIVGKSQRLQKDIGNLSRRSVGTDRLLDRGDGALYGRIRTQCQLTGGVDIANFFAPIADLRQQGVGRNIPVVAAAQMGRSRWRAISRHEYRAGQA